MAGGFPPSARSAFKLGELVLVASQLVALLLDDFARRLLDETTIRELALRPLDLRSEGTGPSGEASARLLGIERIGREDLDRGARYRDSARRLAGVAVGAGDLEVEAREPLQRRERSLVQLPRDGALRHD